MRLAILSVVAIFGVGLAAGGGASGGTLGADPRAEAAGLLSGSGSDALSVLVVAEASPNGTVMGDPQAAKLPTVPPARGSSKVSRDTLLTKAGPRVQPDEEVFSFRGWVFQDRNRNGAWDSDEPHLTGVPITIPGSGITVVSAADGRYELCCFREGIYRIAAAEAGVSVNTAEARHPIIEPINLAIP